YPSLDRDDLVADDLADLLAQGLEFLGKLVSDSVLHFFTDPACGLLHMPTSWVFRQVPPQRVAPQPANPFEVVGAPGALDLQIDSANSLRRALDSGNGILSLALALGPIE